MCDIRPITARTDGRLLILTLTTAEISDSLGAQQIMATIRKRWPWLKHLLGDGAYARHLIARCLPFCNFVLKAPMSDIGLFIQYLWDTP